MTGLGIKGRIGGKEVAVGNPALMRRLGYVSRFGEDTLAEIDREIRTLAGTSKTALVVAIEVGRDPTGQRPRLMLRSFSWVLIHCRILERALMVLTNLSQSLLGVWFLEVTISTMSPVCSW